MVRIIAFFAFLVGLSMFNQTAARADTLFSNEGPIGGAFVNQSGPTKQSFLVEITTLNDIVLDSFSLVTTFASATTGEFRVFSNVNDAPGTKLGSLTGALSFVSTGGFTNAVMSLGSYALSAGSYWVGVSGYNGELAWGAAHDGTKSNGYQMSGDTAIFQPNIGDLRYSITSTTVAVPGPEAGAGLGALAMAGIAFALHRRRKAAITG